MHRWINAEKARYYQVELVKENRVNSALASSTLPTRAPRANRRQSMLAGMTLDLARVGGQERQGVTVADGDDAALQVGGEGW